MVSGKFSDHKMSIVIVIVQKETFIEKENFSCHINSLQHTKFEQFFRTSTFSDFTE